MMTAACFDLTPIMVIPDELMALKAYSRCLRLIKVEQDNGREDRTDLVETAFRGEDGDVSVVSCASCSSQ
jgi:hypothetical protein